MMSTSTGNRPSPSAARRVGSGASGGSGTLGGQKKPVSEVDCLERSRFLQLGASDQPAFLAPGTDVSAKFKGAFCEATSEYEKER